MWTRTKHWLIRSSNAVWRTLSTLDQVIIFVSSIWWQAITQINVYLKRIEFLWRSEFNLVYLLSGKLFCIFVHSAFPRGSELTTDIVFVFMWIRCYDTNRMLHTACVIKCFVNYFFLLYTPNIVQIDPANKTLVYKSCAHGIIYPEILSCIYYSCDRNIFDIFVYIYISLTVKLQLSTPNFY